VTDSQLFAPDVQQTLDLIGIFVFSLSGGLLAVRKNLDIFGIAVLAEVAALGGGVFRDLIIGAPPAAFQNRGYFFTPLVATVVVFFLHPEVERINNAVLLRAARGRGVSCGPARPTPTASALAGGAGVARGLVTRAGGGVVRDVLVNELPSLLRWDRALYAVPALTGGAITAVLVSTHHLNAYTGTFAGLVAFTVRMLALRYDWRAPRAWHRESASSGSES